MLVKKLNFLVLKVKPTLRKLWSQDLNLGYLISEYLSGLLPSFLPATLLVWRVLWGRSAYKKLLGGKYILFIVGGSDTRRSPELLGIELPDSPGLIHSSYFPLNKG